MTPFDYQSVEFKTDDYKVVIAVWDPAVREAVYVRIKKAGYQTMLCTEPAGVLATFAQTHANLLVVEADVGNYDVYDTLLPLYKDYPQTLAVILFADENGSLQSQELLRDRLVFWLRKPFAPHEILSGMSRLIVSKIGSDSLLEQGRALLRINMADPEGHVLLGRAYRIRGDYTRAIAAYNHALQLKSDYAEVYLYLADCYRRPQEREQYCRCLKKAVEYGDADIQKKAQEYLDYRCMGF